jgi:two-component system, OmpR family, sensor histidine kinase KdpD
MAQWTDMPAPVRLHDMVILLSGLLATGAVIAVMRLLPDVSPTTAALALLLVVLLTATYGRLWIAIAVAVATTLGLNFFFFPPVGTFTIADPQNWVALFAYLVTAIVASNLSSAARARARDAIDRRNEVTRLFDLTRDVLLTTESAGAIDALARHVARRFELTGVAICLPGDAGWAVHQGAGHDVHVDTAVLNTALAHARGTIEFDARQRAYGGHMRVGDDADRIALVPLRHGTQAVGLLAAQAPPMDIGALDAVAGVVAIAIERTQFLNERKASELVRQKADLAAALLASLSHDLKTPLTAIRVAVENLRDELDDTQRQAQVSAAVVELERLNRLFQDILDMARIDAAAIDVERQWVTPADIVDAATASVRHTLDGHRLEVEADSGTQVDVDPRLSSAALSHLLENAARYSPAGQSIHIQASTQPDGLRVSVTDHGPGLDPGELDHLFERFYRGRKAQQLSPGTGMGLAITRGLLNAVGGRVWAENMPGRGARFTIVVPGTRRPMAEPI